MSYKHQLLLQLQAYNLTVIQTIPNKLSKADGYTVSKIKLLRKLINPYNIMKCVILTPPPNYKLNNNFYDISNVYAYILGMKSSDLKIYHEIL